MAPMLFAIVALLVLTSPALHASGQPGHNGFPHSPSFQGYPLLNEPTTLSAIVTGDPSTTHQYMVTDYLSQLTNVDLEYTIVPPEDFYPSLQFMISSGDLPDMIPRHDSVLTPALLLQLIDHGALKPLDDLLDQHAPSFAKALETVTGLRSFVTAPDDKIYMMAAIRQDSAPAFWKYAD